jgi:hypothetical protein
MFVDVHGACSADELDHAVIRGAMRDILTKTRIKPGCTGRVRAVLQEAKGRDPEMLEVMEAAGMTRDVSFIDETPSGDYLLTYKRISDIEILKRHLIESQHRFYEFLRAELAPCLEERLDLEAEVSFDTPEAP